MSHVRFAFTFAAALMAAGCATSATGPAASATSATRVNIPGGEEVRFLGHRLVVEKDASGTPTRARAFDPSGKEVPAHVVSIGEVNVCAPRSLTGGTGAQCEPFNILPDGLSFKTGANSLCWYVWYGKIVYYAC